MFAFYFLFDLKTFLSNISYLIFFSYLAYRLSSTQGISMDDSNGGVSIVDFRDTQLKQHQRLNDLENKIEQLSKMGGNGNGSAHLLSAL